MSVSLLSLVLTLAAVSPCQKPGAADPRQAFEKALAACPDDPQVYEEFAAFLITHREFGSARDVIERGLKLEPADAALTLQHGAVLLSLGQLDEALAELERTAATGKSRFYSGMAYRQLGNHVSAQKALTEAWQLGYRDPYLLYSLIEEDRAVGDKPSGMKHFQLFLETFPDSAWMHVLLGDAHFDIKEEEEARREYVRAIELDPTQMDAHYRLGYLDLNRGDNVQAAREFQKEIELNPNFSDAHLFLGETLLRLGNKTEGLAHFRTALQLDSHSKLAYHRLAAVLTDMSQLEEAAQILRQAEKMFPHDWTYPGELARVLTRMNRLEEAHQEADRARVLSAERLKKMDVTSPK